MRGQAADLLCPAGTGAEQKHPHHQYAQQRQYQTDIDPRAFEQTRNLGRRFKGFGLRKVVTQGVFPRAVDQIAQDHDGDIHQHEADQNFIGMEAVSQPSGDARPQHATQCARQQQRHHHPCAAGFVSQQSHTCGEHRTHDVLPFCTNVPHIGAKAQRQPQSNQQQRRGFDH